jgi:hypothetical protein
VGFNRRFAGIIMAISGNNTGPRKNNVPNLVGLDDNAANPNNPTFRITEAGFDKGTVSTTP